MSETAELIKTAREQRGLSQRALAERAGVEQSTIARIERGDADPAYSTVVRLLDAAGFRLPEPEPSIPTLAEVATGGDELDWTTLRSVTDLAQRDPSSVRLLIGAEPPRATGSVARTILAAVAAFLAEQAGIRAPAWARHTPPLDEPWHPTGTPRMVRHTIAETPPAMARYNVWLRTSALRRGHP
ncbi:MAG: multiprotein-bridging factor 1 family protein [Ilumatobacteraceae bacterium]